MTVFERLPGERRKTYSPVCVRLLDHLSGEVPLGRVDALLEVEVQPGQFEPTAIRGTRTMSGLVIYPALSRAANPRQPARKYRVTFSAEYYQVLDAPVTFDVPAFNDDRAPDPLNKGIQTVVLTPAVNYPFPAFLRVLRGDVVDKNTQKPIAGVQARESNRERAITGANGEFALPLRQPKLAGDVDIDVMHPSGAVKSVTITLPDALKKNLRIVFP